MQAAQAQPCLDVALTTGQNVAAAVHLCIPALLVTDKHERLALDTGNPTNHSWVIQTSTITMQLDKLV